MQNGNENIYLSLQRLVWSTFLGALSFQLIAPTVWNYLQSTLKISLISGYYSFIILYSLALPVAFSIWLYLHNEQLKASLFPLDKEQEVDRICTWFLRGLRISMILYVLALVALLYINGDDYKHYFVIILVALTTLSVALIVTGFAIGLKRIAVFEASSNGGDISFKRHLFRVLFGWLAIATLIITLGMFHYQRNSQYISNNHYEISQGFKKLEKHHKLDSLSKNYNDLLLQMQAAHQRKSLDSLSHAMPYLTKIDTLYGANHQDTSKYFGDMMEKVISYTTSSISLSRKQANKLIGNKLRNDQLLMTYLLINLFLSLVSLLFFLRLDCLIRDYECHEPENQLNLRPTEIDYRITLANKIAKRSLPLRLSQGVWLYISVVVWLLVPLFKPVENEKIDTKAPFTMLTLSRPDSPLRNTFTTNDNRMNNSFNNAIDTLLININRQTTAEFPPEEIANIKEQLRQLTEELKAIKSSNEKIQRNTKYLTPNNN